MALVLIKHRAGGEMRPIARSVVTALCLITLAVVAGTTGGCGKNADQSGPHWVRVASATLSGEHPGKVYVGTYDLGDRVRLAWTLSGPEDPPVNLTLRVTSTKVGQGFSAVANSRSTPGGLARRDDNAMSRIVIPGEYRIFFAQRFLEGRGPGYDITLTVWTASTYTPSPAP